ncbi:MAG: diguanylate cyclase [Burkholderiaceae bacterium]|nr:diguanylate cyclase [Burkholderiaceae bacterium]
MFPAGPATDRLPTVRRAATRPRRRLGPLLFAAALLLGLTAAGPAQPSSAAPSAAAQELAQWIHRGRARPEQAVPAIDTLLTRLATEPQTEIEAWVALGDLQVVLADAAGLGQTIARLRRRAEAAGDRGAPTLAPLARSCADALQSQQIRLQGPLGRAERLLGETIERLPAATPDGLRLRFLSWHADLLERASKFEPAARRFQQAITLADGVEAAAWLRAELRAGLAKTLHLAGQVDRARELNRSALELARQSGDDRTLSFVYKTEGVIQSDDSLDQNSRAAEQAMRAALEHALLAGAQRDEIRATANLADMSLRRADYAQALAYAERALVLARALRDRSSESLALVNGGLAHIMLGHKAQGLQRVRASMAMDERAGELAEVAASQGELGHYLEKAGHFGDAYAAYRDFRRLSEQVNRSELQRRLGELQEAFEHEHRRRELELLEREGRFQQAQLESRRLLQWLWATGAVVGAMVLGAGLLLLLRLRAGNRQLEQVNHHLAELAERDSLTGLCNRRGCQAAMRPLWPAPGTLALLDVDHFKRINDGWGHAAGDAVLLALARRLRTVLREGDVVARWGGEEFLIWLPGLRGAEADALVARLLGAVAATPVAFGGGQIAVTASLGFASLPVAPAAPMPEWHHAVALVDAALYQAKSQGRNRACGIHRSDARSAEALAAQAQALAAHWRDGRVDLAAVACPVETAA